ncbi:MAG: hypothetical protein IPI58_03900 [Alphaproteobacteria bacterium]|nr:MAG: hypothetical protein IPI58_03900 [Alphaproteobacteria bacterium]
MINSRRSVTSADIPAATLDFHGAVALAAGMASLVAMILLMADSFDVPLMLGGGVILSIVALAAFRARIALSPMIPSAALLVILGLALLLRIDLYPHLMGGQDQGLYANMAEIFLRARSLFYVDGFRALLPDDLKALYDMSPMAGPVMVNPAQSLMSIAFYPMHPLWMAAARFLFGEGNHTLSLLFFTALYLAGGHRLTLEIFKDRRAALLVLAFLAVNPALVFFSKFPVTEMVAFAFTINGYLFFLRGVRETRLRQQGLFLLIALLCFNGLFYTRPQFLMHLPFLGLLAAACLLPLWPTRQRWATVGFITALVATFGFSLLFYYVYQKELFFGIADYIFHSMAMPKVLIGLSAAAVMGALAVALLAWLRPRGTKPGAHLATLAQRGLALSPWLLLAGFLLSIPSILALYRTGSVPSFNFFVPTNEDPWLIRYHVIYRLMMMLSPVGLLLLFAAPFLRAARTGMIQIAFAFTALAWLVMLLQPYVPYLYYYGRYLSGELVPLGLILSAGLIMQLHDRCRWVGIGAAGLMLVYFLAFSAAQYGHKESEDPAFAKELASLLTRNDILVSSELDDRHIVPLRLTYGRQLFMLRHSKSKNIDMEPLFQKLQGIADAHGGKIYFISYNKEIRENFTLVRKLTFSSSYLSNGERNYNKNASERLMLPTVYNPSSSDLYLYQIDASKASDFTCKAHVDFRKSLGLSESIIGFSGPEEHGRWTDAPKASFQCMLSTNRPAPKRVTITLKAMVTPEHRQRVRISVNNGPAQEFVFVPATAQQTLSLPVMAQPGQNLKLDFDLRDAITPTALGLGDDPRRIAVSVKFIDME